MPRNRFHDHLPPQFGQQAIHILLETLHDGDADDAGLVVDRAHDVHPLVGLQDELEEDHVAVGHLEIAEDHRTGFP